MKLQIVMAGGEMLIIDDVCEHDLDMIRGVMERYHRRWLLKRKQHVIEINSGSSHHLILTEEIRSVSLL